jgi:UDP-N-acetylglucosamine--N-acetylmuramyl-(pentapeptide) pyrophosphoryl-undecaprenol N-acetylglucosamine transferase
MKVYFGACGVGLGHVGRCIPVAKRLLDAGSEVLFSTYSDACLYVDHEGFPLVKAPPIYFAVRDDGGVDFRQTTVYPGAFSPFIFLDQVGHEIRYMRSFRPDVVISDSRASTILAGRLLNIPVLTVLNLYHASVPRATRFLNLSRIADGGIMTILGKLWNAGKEILVPDFPDPYTLSQENMLIPPHRKEHVHLIGPILPVKPGDLPSREVLRQRLKLDGKTVIFVPISGPTKEKEYFAKQMLDTLSKLPDDYQIIVSLANPNNGNSERREGNLRVYDWIPNRFEYLKACDIVISRAGLGTITQSICYGKPSLIVPTPSHTEQQNNSRRAEELGVAKVLNQLELDRESVLSGLKTLMDADCCKRADRLAKDVLPFDGAEAIFQSVEKHCKMGS